METLSIKLAWGKKYGEVRARFDCAKCGQQIRNVQDGYVEFLAGTPRIRCRRKKCTEEDYRSGQPWLGLDLLLESLLLGLGVKGVTIRPPFHIPIAGSLSKSDWVWLKKPARKPRRRESQK